MTSGGYDLSNDQDRDDRRKHLELVSAIVNRMAGASSTAKGWAITIAGAAFGVAAVRDSWYLFVLGIVGLVAFGVIDGLYLHNEKKFRDLYDAIVHHNSIAPLSMDTSGLPVRSKNRSYLSWSVFGFYVPLIVAGVVLLIVSLATPEPDEKAQDQQDERHALDCKLALDASLF
jgi:lipoprotein signal peptidase